MCIPALSTIRCEREHGEQYIGKAFASTSMCAFLKENPRLDSYLKSERIRKRILPTISRIMARQINHRRIHSQSLFLGCFDARLSERSWINLFSKETQNPFSDSFGFKNPIFDFLKETYPKPTTRS